MNFNNRLCQENYLRGALYLDLHSFQESIVVPDEGNYNRTGIGYYLN